MFSSISRAQAENAVVQAGGERPVELGCIIADEQFQDGVGGAVLDPAKDGGEVGGAQRDGRLGGDTSGGSHAP
jgi:hypothetical protein